MILYLLFSSMEVKKNVYDPKTKQTRLPSSYRPIGLLVVIGKIL